MTARVPDFIMACASCGLRVMGRAEHPQWQGIKMAPNSAELQWYCREKEPCIEAFEAAAQQAARAWLGGSSAQGQTEDSEGGGEGSV